MQVEGLEELLTALDALDLGRVEKRKLIVKALRDGSKPIEEEGKSRFQSTFHMRTGLALESISTSVRDQTSTGAIAEIGPKRFYPKFGEYGTVHETSRPWLGPSFDSKVDTATGILADVLFDGIASTFYSGF